MAKPVEVDDGMDEIEEALHKHSKLVVQWGDEDWIKLELNDDGDMIVDIRVHIGVDPSLAANVITCSLEAFDECLETSDIEHLVDDGIVSLG